MLRPFAAVAATTRSRANIEAPRLSYEEVRWILGIPSATARIAAARLGYVARLSATGPAMLVALLQGVGGLEWREALLDDLELFHCLLADKLSELPPRAPLRMLGRSSGSGILANGRRW